MRITLETKVAKKVLSALKVGADMKSSVPALKHARLERTRRGYRFVSTDLRSMLYVDLITSLEPGPVGERGLLEIVSTKLLASVCRSITLTTSEDVDIDTLDFPLVPPLRRNHYRDGFTGLVSALKDASKLEGEKGVKISSVGDMLCFEGHNNYVLYRKEIPGGYRSEGSISKILPAEQVAKAARILSSRSTTYLSWLEEGVLLSQDTPTMSISYLIRERETYYPDTSTLLSEAEKSQGITVDAPSFYGAMAYLQMHNAMARSNETDIGTIIGYKNGIITLSNPAVHDHREIVPVIVSAATMTPFDEWEKRINFKYPLALLKIVAAAGSTFTLYPGAGDNSPLLIKSPKDDLNILIAAMRHNDSNI